MSQDPLRAARFLFYAVQFVGLAQTVDASPSAPDAHAPSMPHVLQSEAPEQRYTVKINFNEPLHASVEASLDVTDGMIFTSSHAGGYEWSDYIRNLRVAQEDGSTVATTVVGPGKWTLDGVAGAKVKVTYDVDLSFTKPQREGAQRGGQFFGKSLYIVNRALFVLSKAAGPREVRFILPSGFRIASPWKSTAAWTYRVRNNAELADNTTVLGQFPTFSITEGRFHLNLALPDGTETTETLMHPALRSILHEYVRMFPDTPDFRVEMTFFRGVEINGEGYRDSATLTSNEPIEKGNRVLWASYLAHELFHHWNGDLINGSDDGPNAGTTEWFAEGATEYIANRTVVRAGIISRDAFLRKMGTNVGMYEFWTWSSPFQGVSLRDAGSKTALPMPRGMIAKTYNRPGVYNGGWVATFCLDMTIQNVTRGEKGIDDVFRLMFSRFGTTGRQWTLDDLKRAASDAAGKDLSSFFDKYISSPNLLPVQQCLGYAGLEGAILNYGGEANITLSANAIPLAQRIRNGLWGAERR